jgi:hypothetical protein
MANTTDTTNFSLANFGDAVDTIRRRINALRLTCVGLNAEGWEDGYDEVEQSIIDLQDSAIEIDAHYKALRLQMLGKEEG